MRGAVGPRIPSRPARLWAGRRNTLAGTISSLPGHPSEPSMSAELPPEVADELAECLSRLAAGEERARDRIIEVCNDRLRELSSRLLGKFAKVRRWDDTDDVA